MLTTTGLKVWKTIKLGTGLKTADGFRKALVDGGSRIANSANQMFRKRVFTASKTERELDLVNVSPRDLGFKKQTTYKKVCAKAKKIGLELCPSEVGPQLCLQYKDQPKGEWLVIGMKVFVEPQGGLWVFTVEYFRDDRWFTCCCVNLGIAFGPHDRFIFVRPRK